MSTDDSLTTPVELRAACYLNSEVKRGLALVEIRKTNAKLPAKTHHSNLANIGGLSKGNRYGTRCDTRQNSNRHERSTFCLIWIKRRKIGQSLKPPANLEVKRQKKKLTDSEKIAVEIF